MVEENNSYFHIKEYKKKINELNNFYFSKIKAKSMHLSPKKDVRNPPSEVEDRLAEMLNEKMRRKEQREMDACMK